MKNHFLKRVMTAGLLVCSLSVMAEDIDLFVAATPDEDAPKPNVLIVLDNTANWTTAFENEKKALKTLFDGLPLDKFNVGLMLFNEPNGKGGYVRAALRLMNETNRPLYSDLVNSLRNASPDDQGSARALGLTMAEAYRYYAGLQAINGHNAGKRDYPNNDVTSTGNVFAASNAIYALTGGHAFASSGSSTYVPGTVEGGCQKNFIIYIGNTTASGNVTKDNTASNTAATTYLEEAAGAAVTQIPLSPSGFADNIADEWARFMKQSPLGITTYTVDVSQGTAGNALANSALLKSMALVSQGKYFLVNSENDGNQIVAALRSIFSEVQAVNSVFASVSLPVSVNTQGTYLNQVFIGMFRPDELARPRWAGNLKQYKLGYNSLGELSTLDADNKDAISSGGTGFIAECARSFWTPTALDSYWVDRPQGSCLTPNTAQSETPDGNVVEKGAQGYKLRTSITDPDNRVVYTCSSGCTDSTPTLFKHSNAAITKSLLGNAAMTDAERIKLIDWARGKNVDNELSKGTTVMRPSVHGDVVHSRPVAINFGGSDTLASSEVVVFYGGNDGMLRAVKGNRDGDGGTELWAFMPPDFYPYINRIYKNNVRISYKGMDPFVDPDTGVEETLEPKSYGVDGAISAYRSDSDTWIFASMRRGGRSVYAFDVSDPTAPEVKWKVGCPSNFQTDGSVSDTGCTTGFAGIGQTWSAPKALKAPGYSVSGAGTEKPMLIMGGGYDVCEDGDPHTCTSTKGNRVYILDADTGALLKTLGGDTSDGDLISRGVVADVIVVPHSVTGLATMAYVADLGGNVYRINIGDDAPADWTITKIASLGGSGADARKFMFAPDVVLDNGKYVLLLGSGDREKPLSTYSGATSVANKFFMLKDDPADEEWLSGETANCGAAVICMDSLESVTYGSGSPTLATVGEKKGWALELHDNEQVVTSAITIFGVVTFSTHEPAPVNVDPNVCTSSLGKARVYNIGYANAGLLTGRNSRFAEIPGGGLPPSPVAGMVTLDNGVTVPFCIGCDSESPLKGGEPPPPIMANQPKSRVYWHIQQ
ncbi:MAG: pilus assembly protein PilY [Betaproteobacteria bacterium]|nr:MAG: pilus assembly protein PilY [Betaproteobacteria bacterium]